MSKINHEEIENRFTRKGGGISRITKKRPDGSVQLDVSSKSNDKTILRFYDIRKKEGKKPSIDFPMDILEYANDDRSMPSWSKEVDEKLKKKGFTILQHTPNKFPVVKGKEKPTGKQIKVYHSPYKHFSTITLPKLELLASKNPNIRGFFIAEGDVCPIDKFNLEYFLKNYAVNQAIWLGYKKKLMSKGEIDYIVGNFLLYFPVEFLPVLRKEVDSKKGKLLYSDRFFTQLVKNGKLKLSPESMASEVEHYSNVAGGVRKKAKKEQRCDIVATAKDDTLKAQQYKVYGDNPVSKEKHSTQQVKEIQSQLKLPSSKVVVKGFGIKKPQEVKVRIKKKKN